MSKLIDLGKYPAAPMFNTLTLDEIKQAHFEHVRNSEGVNLDEGASNPATQVIDAGAYRELLVREQFDAQALQLFITDAQDELLDLIGLTYYQTPRLEGESDERYRQRLLLSPQGFSTAGPDDAYAFHALSSDVRVLDADPFSPTPGVVHVAILDKDYPHLPSDELVAKVDAHLSAAERRPLTDHVTVFPATILQYAAVIDIEVERGASLNVVDDAANAALAKAIDEGFQFRRPITRSALKAVVHMPGVVRATPILPAEDIELGSGQIGLCTFYQVNVRHYEPTLQGQVLDSANALDARFEFERFDIDAPAVSLSAELCRKAVTNIHAGAVTLSLDYDDAAAGDVFRIVNEGVSLTLETNHGPLLHSDVPTGKRMDIVFDGSQWKEVV